VVRQRPGNRFVAHDSRDRSYGRRSRLLRLGLALRPPHVLVTDHFGPNPQFRSFGGRNHAHGGAGRGRQPRADGAQDRSRRTTPHGQRRSTPLHARAPHRHPSGTSSVRFGRERAERGWLLRTLKFRRVSVRPRHPKSDAEAQEAGRWPLNADPNWVFSKSCSCANVSCNYVDQRRSFVKPIIRPPCCRAFWRHGGQPGTDRTGED
jgi:hypothetical protein